MDRLGLTSKLVQHVRTPFMELATVSMANQDMRFNGATMAGFVDGTRTGYKAAYAGVFDPIIPQQATDISDEGSRAGNVVRPAKLRRPKEAQAMQSVAVTAAKHIEYQIVTHGSQGNRWSHRASDLLTHALSADAKLQDKATREASFEYGCRAAWFVARDIRGDDVTDVKLQRELKKIRTATPGVPAIAPDILPDRSASYDDDENRSATDEVLVRGAAALPPLEVEMQCANIGDCRIFGITKRGRKRGGRAESDPEGHRESFALRYARDKATELPGWHGKETTDTLPGADAVAAAARKLDPSTSGAEAVLLAERRRLASAGPRPDEPHEYGEELGLVGDHYVAPLAEGGVARTLDPLYELNQRMAFNTQEAALRERRQRLVPLSADHRPSRLHEKVRLRNAGGNYSLTRHVLSLTPPPTDKRGVLEHGYEPPTEVQPTDMVIPVSRAFGLHKLKSDPSRSALDQILSAAPDTKTWNMSAGDVTVMATHALFETRSGLHTSVDTVAEVVLEAFARAGVSTAADGSADGVCAEAARDLCDLAIRFGCPRNVSVTVARAREAVKIPRDVTEDDVVDSAELGERIREGEKVFERSTQVIAGPVYPGAVRGSRGFRACAQADAARMGKTLADMLLLRFVEVGPQLRDLGIAVTTAGLRNMTRRFPMEGGHLAAVMADEADFYRDCPFAPEAIDAANPTPEQREYFARLAKMIEGE